MTGRAFFALAVVRLLLAALCLALAAVFNSGVLAVAGAVFALCVLVAREGWFWRGDLRGWLTVMGALAAAVFVAFAISASA